MVHLYHRTLLNNNKEQTIDIPNKLEESQGNYVAQKMANPRKLYIVRFFLVNILEMAKP